MYLRRLEVHGFKAFADRQRFEFGPGMTVIAGPNGSGKSNVADALRWALGEQSAKQIRARKTEDVIFSGSDKRRQMGLAEVTLYLDNSDGWMPIDFAEVAVTRRAHRSGENEYLINNQHVRLSDVLDLFRRAQVGQNSYAHMSQGLVDEVLALRPSDRRELIEEAADVRRHRHQLTLSERRLVETRDNLGHVRMLIREVEPRLRALARQSRRASRYQELAADLSDALQVVLEVELREGIEVQTASQATHDQQAQAFNAARIELQKTEVRLKEVEQQLVTRRTALETAQARERELAEEGLRLEQAVALAAQRLELLAVRRTELEASIAVEDIPADDASAIDATIKEFDSALTAAQTELARQREALTSADEATRTVLRDLNEGEARRARFEMEIEDGERRVREAQERAAADARAREQAAAQRIDLLRLIEEQDILAAEHARAGAAFAEASRIARERRESAERRLEEEVRAEQAATEALRAAQQQVKQLEERASLIEMLRDSMPSGNAGAQALVEAGKKAPVADEEPLTGIVDAVSRLIQVPDGLEIAIESALAEHLSAVVVEHREEALAALAYLRDHASGTVTVYPLDAIEHRYPLNLFNERGVVGIASKLVRCDQKYRPLVDTLLGRVIIVEDLRVAEQMITRGLGSVVTRDGTLLRPGGSIYGGRTGGNAEQFSLQRELEGLPAQIEAARSAIAPAEARLEHAKAVVLDARDAVTAARKGVDEAEEHRRTHDGTRTAIERRHAELASELKAIDRRLEQAQADAATAGAEWRTRVETARTNLDEVTQRIGALRDRSAAVGTERDTAAEAVAVATQKHAAVEAERRTLIAQRDERVAARKAAVERLEAQRAALEALVREQEDLDLTLRDRREHLANNRSARAEAQGLVGPAHAATADLAQEERELATTRGDAQRALLAAEREMLESENRLRQAAERVQRLHAEIVEENMLIHEDGTIRPEKPIVRPIAGAGDDDMDEDGEFAGVAGGMPAVRGGADIDVPELRGRITELRGQIRGLGPVNVEAMEDLSAEQERHDFLVAQVGDLEAAEGELREAIRDLKKLIRTKFVETFHVVNERFGEYFTRFFGGGQAELRLVEADDADEDAEAGVDIFAQPPGKRISNLTVLSGGERSMTSVALLFALLSVNPAPVVVLDEVDAALDEANVNRFVGTLLELRERTQFVVISHNRRTIEAADAIYGVSMGDDSASRVLSLKLAEMPQSA